MNYPKFLDNKKFFQLHDEISEIEQLSALSENLKRIHVITTKSYKSFDDLILEYLKVGLEVFDMKIGIVSRIEGDEYFVCNAVSPDNSLGKGDVFPLEGTYCREVYNSQEVLGFPHVGSLESMKDHPVYQNMKLESYLSAPIYVGGKLFGTLNFSSVDIRDYGFSENERDLISLMANSIGNFLFLNEKEQEILNSNDRLKKLVGYVAHDLRTPLGNIRSLADFIETDPDSECEEFLGLIKKSADDSLEMIYTILDMAAMGTGKIELNKELNNLEDVLEHSLSQFEHHLEKKGLKIKKDFDDIPEVEIDFYRMEQVFSNLFSNATKYSKPGTTIEVLLKKQDDMNLCFTIQNIKSDENNEVHSEVNKSIGFGLEIVREILKLHKAKLWKKEKGDFYSTGFIFEIPSSK